MMRWRFHDPCHEMSAVFTDRIRGKGNAIGSVRPSVFGLEIEVPTDL